MFYDVAAHLIMMFLRVPQKLGTFNIFCINNFIYNIKTFQNSINTWHVLQPTSIAFSIGTNLFPVSSVYSSWRGEVGLYILKMIWASREKACTSHFVACRNSKMFMSSFQPDIRNSQERVSYISYVWHRHANKSNHWLL